MTDPADIDLNGDKIDTTCNCDSEWDGFDHHYYPCNYPPCVMANDLIGRMTK